MSPSRSTTRTRISLASGLGARRSPLGFIGAVLLHAAVILATLFTWEHRLDIAQESSPIVPVNLVTIAAKTNIMPAARPAPKLEPKPLPQVAPENLNLPTPSVPEEAEEAPPEQAPSEPKLKQSPPVIVPRPRPEMPTQSKKSAVNEFDAMLNGLLAKQIAKNSNQDIKGVGAQTGMSADLRSIFLSEVQRCFQIGAIAGAPNVSHLEVWVQVSLNPDGTIARKPQLAPQSVAAANANSYVNALAGAALRAIYQCAPYNKLPVSRYAEWRSNQIRFSPQDFVDQ